MLNADIQVARHFVSVADMHYLDEKELQGLDNLQGCLCSFREEGVGFHNTCEDKVHQCKCLCRLLFVDDKEACQQCCCCCRLGGC